MLIIVMDANFEQLKPKQRVVAIKNLSGFLSLQHVCSSVYHIQKIVISGKKHNISCAGFEVLTAVMCFGM
jgi:hypothetical protein